jgi:hypothetical protein
MKTETNTCRIINSNKSAKYPSDSYEQMVWDSILVKGWKADANVGNMVQMFILTVGKEAEKHVRRIPKYNAERYTTRRFVAAYLPKLNDFLWSEILVKDILFYLLSSEEDVLNKPVDTRKSNKEKKEIAESMNLLKSQRIQSRVLYDTFESRKRSNQWSVIK